MKYFIPIAGSVLTLACHQQSTPATQATIIAQDPTTTIVPNITYITKASVESGGYLLSFKASFKFPEGNLQKDSSSYFYSGWLFLENKTTHKTDSLELADISTLPAEMELKDVTEEFHFTSPLAEFTYMVENDALHHTFFNYANDSLEILFLTDARIISMQRRDTGIYGVALTRVDNLPYSQKYSFILSLSDRQLNVIKPDTEILGFQGEARTDINAFILNGSKPIPYIIKEGRTFRLDTLYRTSQLIRMTISDSVPIYGRPENVLPALTGNDAG